MHRIIELDFATWSPFIDAADSLWIAGELELGKVIYLPHVGFYPEADEKRFLDARWLSGTHKNISFEPERAASTGGVRGAAGSLKDLGSLGAMIRRFRAGALTLVCTLFPAYTKAMRVEPSSFRPGNVEEHKLSRRKDDTLLHVDAFPSRPNRGDRILRVFSNIHPNGVPRLWKIGDLFHETAREFASRVKPPLPGSAALLQALHVTKSRRSLYDHLMLGLHDRMKENAAYQRRASHLTFAFPAGSTWICYSDQTAHAALAGQFMLEQTLFLPVKAQYFPERSPLRVLERLRGVPLA